MKKNISILLFQAILLGHLSAQSQHNDLLAELNKDIWIPFVTGVNTNNPDLYNGVNSKDFYWVLDGAKPRIMNMEEYIEDARIVMKSRADKGIRTKLDIRFIQRNVNAEFASEQCVIKYTSTSPGKEPEIFYGMAHVFSRKEQGTWKKIIQHAMTTEVTQEMFESAQSFE